MKAGHLRFIMTLEVDPIMFFILIGLKSKCDQTRDSQHTYVSNGILHEDEVMDTSVQWGVYTWLCIMLTGGRAVCNARWMFCTRCE